MNYDKLNSLLGNDDNMVNRFLETFKSEIPNQLSDLRDAVESKNWEMASNMAHAIKSQVRYLDLEDIATIANQIERSTEHQENLEEVAMDLIDLEDALYQVLDEI